MTRLQSELHRLYLTAPPAGQGDAGRLDDPRNGARCLVLELARPADWDALARVWRGVQRDMDLPAPAIAITGVDGFQLWFSLAQAVPLEQAQAFLRGLQSRYLPDVAPHRIRRLPMADATAPQGVLQAPAVPAEQPSGDWSAFVAPDLAPVFVDTPWLDIPPGFDGQADVLHGLAVTPSDAFDAALRWLASVTPRPSAAPLEPVSVQRAAAAVTPLPDDNPAAAPEAPRAFLHRVMNDTAVPMALRIEAAKVLLQHPPV